MSSKYSTKKYSTYTSSCLLPESAGVIKGLFARYKVIDEDCKMVGVEYSL